MAKKARYIRAMPSNRKSFSTVVVLDV